MPTPGAGAVATIAGCVAAPGPRPTLAEVAIATGTHRAPAIGSALSAPSCPCRAAAATPQVASKFDTVRGEARHQTRPRMPRRSFESRISLIRKSPPGAERKLHSSPSGGHSPDASPREPVVLLQVMPCASREADKNPHAVLLVGMEPTPSQGSAARSTALPSWPASSWGRTVRPHDDDVFQPSWARIAPAGCSVVCTLT